MFLVWLALGGAAVWLSSYYDRSASLYLIKRVSVLPCPTCGFRRWVLSLFSGRPGRGWLYNPLLFSVLVLGILATGIRILFARAVKIRLTRVERVIAWLVAGGLFAANWAYVILYVG